MFEGAFSPMHWLLVLLIALIVFGPKRLPEIGKGLGTAIRGFKEGLRELEHQASAADDTAAGKAKPGSPETTQGRN